MFPHSVARGKRVGDTTVLFPLKLGLGEAAEPKHDRPASINRRRREVASELLCPPLFQHRQPDVRLAVEASCYSPDFKHLYGPDRGDGPRFDCYGKRGALQQDVRVWPRTLRGPQAEKDSRIGNRSAAGVKGDLIAHHEHIVWGVPPLGEQDPDEPLREQRSSGDWAATGISDGGIKGFFYSAKAVERHAQRVVG